MSDVGQIVAFTDKHLNERPVRAPNYEAESKALRRLAEQMGRQPDDVLLTLCQEVLTVCGAESAGVSLLVDENSDEFQWPAIAGLWAAFQGGGMPRNASPCGLVIQANRSLLLHDVERQFPAAAVASPPITEILLAPFRVNGRPIGTVWAIMHSDPKIFDREDQRLLESLAHFAAAAYKMAGAVGDTGKAREQLKLVNLELSHRLKNMLSVILAISSSSLRTVTPRSDVLVFQARLRALAAAQDILVNHARGAADIGELANAAIGNLCDADRVEISGPQVEVGPSAALSLSLILHELVTNALKYGALASPDGRVTFVWSITDEEKPRIIAHWTERGGPPVELPKRKGFGTRLISMGLIGQGDATVRFQREGLEVAFAAPLRSVTEGGLNARPL